MLNRFPFPLLALAAGLSLLSPVVTAAPAPVIEAASQPGAPASAVKELEARITKLERLLENRTLVEMAMQIEALQRENQQLLGQLEEQAYELENLKKRQRDLYLDIDSRLARLEAARAAAPAAGGAASAGSVAAGVAGGAALAATPSEPSPAAAAAPDVAVAAGVPVSASAESAAAPGAAEVDPQAERADYERAFNLLKEGRYDLAVAAFKTFVQTYPSGKYTDNAQYWLGEANYVQRNFKAALVEFEKVVNNFPDSPKRPDALLKMGYTYQELGDNDKARLALNSVRMNYPDTTAARLASKRLQELKP